MKSNYISLYLVFSFTLMLVSCTGVETTTRGLENEAYLEFFGSGYSTGVEVIVDGDKKFKADVKSKDLKRPKGNLYAILPGRHLIEVYRNDTLIYKKEIFVSTQETHRVNLP